MPMTDAAVTKIFSEVFLAGTETFPSGTWLALYTDAACTTECSAGGYARQAVTFTATSARVVSNTALITMTVGGSDVAVAWAIVDASTGGDLWATGTLPTPQSAGSFPVQAGALRIDG